MVRYHSEFLAGLDVVNLRQLIGVLTLQENAQTILANTMRVMETLPATYRQQEELVKAKRQNRVAMPSLDGIRLDIQRLQETLSSQASKTDLTLNLHLANALNLINFHLSMVDEAPKLVRHYLPHQHFCQLEEIQEGGTTSHVVSPPVPLLSGVGSNATFTSC